MAKKDNPPEITGAIGRREGGRDLGFGIGEWGMGNGEWGMGNGEWGIGIVTVVLPLTYLRCEPTW